MLPIFFSICGIYGKIGILWKKRWTSKVIFFWNYRLEKAELVKCPKKPIDRTLRNNQHVKVSETLLKSARQYFCHIFWSLWKKNRPKISVLVVSKILRLFVNILTPDDQHSLSVKGSVYRDQFRCYYLQIKKYFLNFFLHFQKLHKNLNILKKKMSLTVICFWNYRLQNAGLLKCIKSPVSDHLRTFTMLECPKDCSNICGTLFVIFFDHSEKKSAGKTLF